MKDLSLIHIFLDKNLLNEYNPVNNVPDDFLFAVKEMYENVSELSLIHLSKKSTVLTLTQTGGLL